MKDGEELPTSTTPEIAAGLKAAVLYNTQAAFDSRVQHEREKATDTAYTGTEKASLRESIISAAGRGLTSAQLQTAIDNL